MKQDKYIKQMIEFGYKPWRIMEYYGLTLDQLAEAAVRLGTHRNIGQARAWAHRDKRPPNMKTRLRASGRIE